MTHPSIFDYIKSEADKFETETIKVGTNWDWSFLTHVQMIFHLKNGVFYTGANNWLRAFKNIMEPILNLAYWTEDIEVKDVVFYIEQDDGKVLSFFLKKYHDEVYVKEHDLDTLFDEITESDIDYGGVLVQKGVEMPEVLPLQSIAFCDQTDTLGSPIAFKHYFSPDKLRSMSKYGWGEKSNGATISLDDLCVLANAEKETNGLGGNKNQVPGKQIEVYIIRGNLPEGYLKDNDNMEYHCNQLQIVAFYTKEDSTKEGVVLYRKKEEEGNLKFFTSKKVYQRALGRGEGETLLHPQIWTNFLTIHKMGLLEAASKVGLYTDDPSYTTKNKIQDMENLEITTIEDGKKIHQVPTVAPANIQLYANDINDWYTFAQTAGAANDPIMGAQSPSGTTFRGQERSVAQGKGSHDRRRGQRAKFLEDIYRTWIIPDIKKEILKGKKFLSTLSTEELQWVSDQVTENAFGKYKKDVILYGNGMIDGQVMTEEMLVPMKEEFKRQFLKKGNKHLLEVLKDEFKDVEIKLGINISNKQKDLVQLSDKLLSIFQYIFANPVGFQQAMQIPALAKSFENILEYGGLNISDFSSLMQAPTQPIVSPMQQEQVQPQPLALNTQ